MTDRNRVSVGCVGAGFFSSFHLNAWHRIAAADVVGIADPKAGPRDDAVPVFDSLSAMLNATQAQLLDVITPPDTHRELIEEALAFESVQLIVCQKPFCKSLSDAMAVTEAAKARGKTLVVHENFRFQPWFRVIKEKLDEALIGDVLQITVRLRPGDGQGPKAYLERQPYFQTMERLLIHETGVHYIDTFRYLLGEPEAVYADLRRLNPAIVGEDAGYVVFDYESGVRAVLDGNRLLDHAAEDRRCTMCEVLVEGTDGTLSVYGDGSVRHRRFHEQDETTLFTLSPTDQFGGDCAYHLQVHLIEHLLQGSELENQAHDYLSVLRQEALVYESSKLGQKLSVTDPAVRD